MNKVVIQYQSSELPGLSSKFQVVACTGNAPSSFDGNNKDEDDHSNTGVTSDGMRRQQVVLSWVLGWFLVVVPHVLSLQ